MDHNVLIMYPILIALLLIIKMNARHVNRIIIWFWI